MKRLETVLKGLKHDSDRHNHMLTHVTQKINNILSRYRFDPEILEIIRRAQPNTNSTSTGFYPKSPAQDSTANSSETVPS